MGTAFGRENEKLPRSFRNGEAVATVGLHPRDKFIVGEFLRDAGASEGPAGLEAIKQLLDRRAGEGEGAATAQTLEPRLAAGPADALGSDLRRKLAAYERVVAVA